jgi:DNA-binding Lrp family transcriptional regulator
MSPLTHFTIYPAILMLGLSMTEKLLLCLALTFNSKGLKMSNPEIGRALNVSRFTVSNTLSSLRKRKLIHTEKAGSRYRKIRLNMDNLLNLLRSEVDETYLTATVNLLNSSSSRLLNSLGSQHKERSKRKRDSSARDAQPLGDDSTSDDGYFDRFWSAYPKKVGKGASRKAFAKRGPDTELLQKMLDALEWQRQSPQWQKDNLRYVPNPATWLNEERWEDEKPEPQRGDPDWLPTEEEAEKLLAEVEA